MSDTDWTHDDKRRKIDKPVKQTHGHAHPRHSHSHTRQTPRPVFNDDGDFDFNSGAGEDEEGPTGTSAGTDSADSDLSPIERGPRKHSAVIKPQMQQPASRERHNSNHAGYTSDTGGSVLDNVCRLCHRGNSPKTNQIVFCDECRTPYHQLCHNPPIDRLVVDVADAQWFCKYCQPKRRERPLETGKSGEGFSTQVKKTYLSSLSKAQLVELILYAENNAPKLPLYSPQTHSIVLQMQLENSNKTDTTKSNRRLLSSINYEDLLIDTLKAKSNGEEASAQQIWKWIASDTNPDTVDPKFVQAATMALQRALREGKILKRGKSYRVNPHYQKSSEISLSLLISLDDEAMFSDEVVLKLPPATEEDLYYTIDDNDDVFSARLHDEQEG
ncbi:SWM histone demethylase complex subunit phf1 [Yarrowia sp. C11]|nr:SWM histone demethylase complex subunit phf1 [Yarrowia sp. C11]KAG5370756.1 SWM histone demethylase complex subunit phf1 [Yarrowia sp. E02]